VKILRTSVNVKDNAMEVLHASVHEPKLRLVDASGNPIIGATIQMGAKENGRIQDIGTTDSLGTVQAHQVPSGTYIVKAYWYGEDISPDPLIVTATREYLLVARNVGTLVIQVSGLMGQGLQGSNIEVWRGGKKIFVGATNNQGFISVLLPYGEYIVKAVHGGLETTSLFELKSPAAIAKLSIEEFVYLFGVGLKLITAITYALISITLILILIILIHEYVIWRRKHLPHLFS